MKVFRGRSNFEHRPIKIYLFDKATEKPSFIFLFYGLYFYISPLTWTISRGLNQPKAIKFYLRKRGLDARFHDNKIWMNSQIQLNKFCFPYEDVRGILWPGEIPSSVLLVPGIPKFFQDKQNGGYLHQTRILASLWNYYFVINENFSFCPSIAELLKLYIKW